MPDSGVYVDPFLAIPFACDGREVAAGSAVCQANAVSVVLYVRVADIDSYSLILQVDALLPVVHRHDSCHLHLQ